ncbi:LptF/LptG family permease [Candidatus Pelagibacter sp.]|nr:LptF/LptG family permease [Candidatus Pelagibacter sp.]|tara:strand:- start:400 stop:1476 length:1077 start_codon:yes stop_codon:yes gene_type:complete
MIQIYQKYIIHSFLKNLFKVFIFFFALVVILNLFEEISFFKNVDVDFYFPVFITLLNVPSVLFDILPFIFLIATLLFFTEILDKNEINVYKIFGLTNAKIIKTITLTSFFCGVLSVLILYNISSNLKFLYFDIKNSYSQDDKYLAVVTANGLWIKDEIDEKISIINAEKINGNFISNVLITEYDLDFNFKRMIVSKNVNIEKYIWNFNEAQITENNVTNKIVNFTFKSNFNSQKISNLFSNLSSLNFLQLKKLKNDYKLLGYSTTSLSVHEHKLYSYPLYLSIMVCISSILMLNIKHNNSKTFNLFIGVFISVLIYYINYFFNILVESKEISHLTSVWGPQLILILIVSIGLVKINEK